MLLFELSIPNHRLIPFHDHDSRHFLSRKETLSPIKVTAPAPLPADLGLIGGGRIVSALNFVCVERERQRPRLARGQVTSVAVLTAITHFSIAAHTDAPPPCPNESKKRLTDRGGCLLWAIAVRSFSAKLPPAKRRLFTAAGGR